MSMQITLAGTVKADGTLELDDKVAMPEGRVLVTVQPAVQPAPDDAFWKVMNEIWAGQRAAAMCLERESRSTRICARSGTMPKLRSSPSNGSIINAALGKISNRAGRRDILMVFLDTSVVIYSVEQPPGWGDKAAGAWAHCTAGATCSL